LAIVGGGLSGLSSAFYFLRNLSPAVRKNTRVIIFEKQKRTGGWCQSIAIPVAKAGSDKLAKEEEMGSKFEEIKSEGVIMKERKDAELVFETGPRSIRPVGLPGWLTVEMVS
jgi:oxygen-dependent protoporphyrinogen oxidase